MPQGEAGKHDQRLQAAQRSGRDIYVDPALNPTQNAPYYIEWFCMVVQAQHHIQTVAQGPGGVKGGGMRALMLTAEKQADDPHVDLDETHALFQRFYPRGEARR